MNSTQAIINLNNLVYNYQSIRRKTKKKVMAVVKADAYGHGMIECVKKLETNKHKPEYYGVALLKEAIELRKSKITKSPILCFSPFNKNEIDNYYKHKIIPTVASNNEILYLSKVKLEKNLKVHVNVNSGMNRLGIKYDEAEELIEQLVANPKVKIDGIYTHFATSDEEDKVFAKLQLSRFKIVTNKLLQKKIKIGIIHAANSGAILDIEDSYFDMVRPGISLYGYYPSLETTESIKLRPVMSIVSQISTVRNLTRNNYVGYGRKFRAKKDTIIGSIPIGYADGLLRALSGKISVIVKDKVFSQIGRISMDRISINLENEKIKEGTKVILLGKSKNHEIDAWHWSKILDTIPYEITCTISKRVKRIYTGNK